MFKLYMYIENTAHPFSTTAIVFKNKIYAYKLILLYSIILTSEG